MSRGRSLWTHRRVSSRDHKLARNDQRPSSGRTADPAYAGRSACRRALHVSSANQRSGAGISATPRLLGDLDELTDAASGNRRLTLHLVPPVVAVLDLYPAALAWPVAASCSLCNHTLELMLTDRFEKRLSIIESFGRLPISASLLRCTSWHRRSNASSSPSRISSEQRLRRSVSMASRDLRRSRKPYNFSMRLFVTATPKPPRSGLVSLTESDATNQSSHGASHRF